MKTSLISLLGVALAWGTMVLAGAGTAEALPPFWKEFSAKYVKPESTNEAEKSFAAIADNAKTGRCNVCHVQGELKKVRNRYGTQLDALLDKANFKAKRLKAEPEKVHAEIVAALDQVAAMRSDANNASAPTFGDLIAQGKLPGAETLASATPPADTTSETNPPAVPTAAVTGGGDQPEANPAITSVSDPAVSPTPAAAPTDPPAPSATVAPPAAPEEAVTKIREMGGVVRQVALNDDSIEVDFHLNGEALTDDGLANLKALDKVVEVHLKNAPITDAGVAHLAGLTALKRLHLENTKVTDAALAHLGGLANLTYLNLYGTAVTDAGLESLASLRSLRKLFLWQTQVTDAGVAKLQAALPDLEIVR